MLFRLNGLMQTVGIAASRHNTSGKLIDDHNLIILHHIILIAEHQIVCAKRKDHIVLNLKVLRICQIINMEELLHLVHTLLGKVDNLVLLVDDKVSGLLLFHTHDGIHLGVLRNILTSGQLASKNIAGLV